MSFGGLLVNELDSSTKKVPGSSPGKDHCILDVSRQDPLLSQSLSLPCINS